MINSVRFLLILFSLIIASNNIRGQVLIEGVYKEVKEIWAYEHNTLEFFKDGTFCYEKSSDFGDFRGYGKYNLSKDSIKMLFYEVPQEIRSNRIMEGESPQNGGTLIQIRDGINPHKVVQGTFDLYIKDSIVSRGASDLFGNIYIDSGLTNVRVVVRGFGDIANRRSKFYRAQNIDLEHTNARLILLLFSQLAPASQFIEGGHVINCKAKLSNGNSKLRLLLKKPDFFHPNGKTVTYAVPKN